VATRATAIGMLAGTVLVVVGCGGTKKYVNQPRQPLPVNVTVYISPSRVSASPASLGAGPVVFLVTNHALTAEPLVIASTNGSGGALASTAPINPEGTAQVSIDFTTPGDYTLSTTGDATAASTRTITPAQLHIGAQRAGADTVLLTP